MNKKMGSRIIAVFMSICLILLTFFQSGITFAATSLVIDQAILNGKFAIDLTRCGNLDWLHLRAKGTAKDIIQITKSTSPSAISFGTLAGTSSEGKQNRGSDANYVSYTWTDSMTESYQTGTDDTGFALFYPTASRNIGTYPDVGWHFTVQPQAEETAVIFATGVYNSKVNVNFYMNDVLVDTKPIQAGTTSTIYKFQVVVPANAKFKAEAVVTQVTGGSGNSSFSGVVVGKEIVIYKMPLQGLYDLIKDKTQTVYTDESWKVFDDARTAAKEVLDNVDTTHEAVDNAKNDLQSALSALVKKATNFMIDYTGNYLKEYAFGNSGDQGSRYQTFTSTVGFDMEYVQVGIIKKSYNASNLIVKLYGTNAAGLPTGSPLAQTTVSKDDIVNDTLTTAMLNYTIEANKRYAIVLSQQTPVTDQYRWIVKNLDDVTSTEYFGKTNSSGSFVSEATLGTGMLKIVKKLSDVRITFENLLTSLKSYNGDIYTVESWLTFLEALDNAKKFFNNFDATDEEINAVISQLQSAKDNLVLNFNVDQFDSILAKLDGAVVNGYTSSSADAFYAAVANAKLLGSSATNNDKIQAYNTILAAISNLQVSGQYTASTDPGLTGSFGFEGDMNAPIAFIDGSFKLVSRNLMINFGVAGLKDKGVSINWYNRDGYLPCYVSEYTADNVDYKIEEFANKHTIDGNPVEVVYVKVTTVNKSGGKRLLPVVSKQLIPINEATATSLVIEDNETIVREYAIKADRFGNEGHLGFNYDIGPKVDFPSDKKIIEAAMAIADTGNDSIFENNYADMKAYWDNRLSSIIDIQLPNSKDAENRDSLVNAYKAGYIYTQIIKDNTFLHVGENGYDILYSHDTINILQAIINAGDFKDARNYLESVPVTGGINIENGKPDQRQFWDANWKQPWAYATYLSKSGDIEYIKQRYEDVIKPMAHSIHDDRTGTEHDGIMKTTFAIDQTGDWTVDNFAALIGLTSYKYICIELAKKESDASQKSYYESEAEWAKTEYYSLLEIVKSTLQNTIDSNNLNYIPCSMVKVNEQTRCNDPRDANWASMLLFGGFQWDGYLFGADQSNAGYAISMIDDTYKYGIERRAYLGTSPYNFGGYPHGWYSSAYNAGYGNGALRGEAYRDIGIKAYEFMINSAMGSPFGWWEGIGPTGTNYPTGEAVSSTLWNRDNAAKGGGSNQHMWGQATALQVLYDSLIAERIYNDNKNIEIIIGRGIPKEWVTNATEGNNVVANVQNYPVFQGGRAGYTIERINNKLLVKFNLDTANAKIDLSTELQMSIELPSLVNNIVSTSVGTFDNVKGTVKVPVDTTEVAITLADLPDTNVPVTDIVISSENGSSNITTKGGILQLVATVSPAEVTDKSVTWSIVIGSECATISDTGLLTAKANGTVQVKATANDGSNVESNIFTVNITGQNISDAEVIPASANYDLATPGDVSTTIIWNDATTVTGVVYDGTHITTPDVFVVSESALTINNSFLTSLGLVNGDVAEFEIYFDKGNSVTFAVNIIDSSDPTPVNHNISVKSDEHGTASANVTSAAIGAEVTLTATPNEGYRFKEWQVNYPLGLTINGNAFTMPGEAVSVKAIFEVNPVVNYNLTVNGSEHGTASANVTSAAIGAEVILTATPNEGYRFKEWQVNYPLGLTINGNAFTMPGEAVSVKAIFEANPVVNYNLTVNGSYAQSSGSGSYAAGSTVTVNAGSRANYTFAGWSSSDGVVFADTNSSTTTFVMPAKNMTVTAAWNYIGGSSSNSGSNSSGSSGSSTTSTPATKNYTADIQVSDVSGNGTKDTTLPVKVDTKTGTAAFDTTSKNDLVSNGVTTVITVPSIPGVDTYTMGIPVSDLSTDDWQGALKVDTRSGSITVPSNMLTGATGVEGTKAEISIGQVNKSQLPEEVKTVVGDRPLIQLSMTIDGKKFEWKNPEAAVKVSIPYKPSEAELANPEGIIIWYIDDSGMAHAIPNGHYDAATDTVTFTTTHFSYYAVGYNTVSFSDVSENVWYGKAVNFVAARGITSGKGNGIFSPNVKLTRSEFIVMLLQAYDIAPDSETSNNFADAGNTYYSGYLAAAKRLGISGGVGNNMFAPGKEITRQEMFTMLYNALKVLDKVPQGNSGKALSSFTDSSKVASWAKESMTALVEAGIVGGINGKLTPNSTTTRAQMAQILYNLLSK